VARFAHEFSSAAASLLKRAALVAANDSAGKKAGPLVGPPFSWVFSSRGRKQRGITAPYFSGWLNPQ
jgi:hypothetical protein